MGFFPDRKKIAQTKKCAPRLTYADAGRMGECPVARDNKGKE